MTSWPRYSIFLSGGKISKFSPSTATVFFFLGFDFVLEMSCVFVEITCRSCANGENLMRRMSSCEPEVGKGRVIVVLGGLTP